MHKYCRYIICLPSGTALLLQTNHFYPCLLFHKRPWMAQRAARLPLVKALKISNIALSSKGRRLNFCWGLIIPVAQAHRALKLKAARINLRAQIFSVHNKPPFRDGPAPVNQMFLPVFAFPQTAWVGSTHRAQIPIGKGVGDFQY